MAPLEGKYARYSGRPAIHPEVMIRALLDLVPVQHHLLSDGWCMQYRKTSPLDGSALWGSTTRSLTTPRSGVFIERIGRDGFAQVFKRFNQELLRMGMLSKQLYVDSSLVRANLALHNLYPSGLTIEQFQAKAIAENGLFVLEEEKGEDDVGKPSDGTYRQLSRRYFQDAKGRVQLSPVDLSARRRPLWRRRSSHMLSYEDNIAVDGNGFILLASVDALLDPGVEGGQRIARETSLQAHPDNEGCGLPGTFRLPR